MSGIRFFAGSSDLPSFDSVQTGSDAYLVCYPMGTGTSFPGGKAAIIYTHSVKSCPGTPETSGLT
jgi:hypothetical protein